MDEATVMIQIMDCIRDGVKIPEAYKKQASFYNISIESLKLILEEVNGSDEENEDG